jgi:hypothetical protein
VCRQDIHSPFTTVLEALQFSASLRLPASLAQHKKDTFVEVRFPESHDDCLII